MSDFIFNPEKGFDPGEIGADPSQLPVVHKLNPLFEQFNKVNIPLTPGGGPPIGKTSGKPILHTGDIDYTTFSHVGFAKNSEDESVQYQYKPDTLEPNYASVLTDKGNDKGVYKWEHFQPDEINFPPHPAARPPKPSLLVGELTSKVDTDNNIIYNKGSTPDGGTVYYNYSGEGKPYSADVYGVDGNYEAYYSAKEGTYEFPPAPKPVEEPAKTLLSYVEGAGGVHYEESTFDENKKELVFTAPLKPVPDYNNVYEAPLENGHTAWIFYGPGGKPEAIHEYLNKDGTDSVDFYYASDVNFPVSPDIYSAPSKFPGVDITPAKSPKGWESVGGPSEPVTTPKPTPTSPPPPPRETPYPELKLLRQLTPEEVKSVKEYTGSSYSSINGYLRRKNNLHTDDFERDEEVESHIARLDRAIEQHPLENETTVYRGISHELFGKIKSRLELGESFTHHGYMSTSTRENFAEGWKNGTRLVITAPKGTKALPVETLSYNSSENEIIFPQETRLKLIRKEPNVMYFEVISNGR